VVKHLLVSLNGAHVLRSLCLGTFYAVVTGCQCIHHKTNGGPVFADKSGKKNIVVEGPAWDLDFRTKVTRKACADFFHEAYTRRACKCQVDNGD